MSVFRESMPQRKRWEKALPWLAALLLAVGVGAMIVKFVPGTSGSSDSSATKNPTIVPTTPPKTVKLSNPAREVAGRFILTAVKRRNLGEAWKLSGPQIRQDLTRKEWLTGNIPVVPYLTPTGVTPLKIDFSYKDHALVEVAMVPKKGVKGETELFWLELRRVGTGTGKHWLVWSWTPNLPPAIPANPTGGG